MGTLTAPASLINEFAQVIGQENAELIAAEFGGRHLVFSKMLELPANHHLAQILPLEAACELHRHYQGCTVYVPRQVGVSTRRTVLEELRAGKTVDQIARHLNKTSRWVEIIRAALLRSGESLYHEATE